MSNPFLAEIRIFTGNFAPAGWAMCDGQILPISQNTALFSLLGTTYGGNGTSNFQLPNMQGSAPMHPGQGPGLTLRDLGEIGGETQVALLQTEMPVHTHTAQAGSTSNAGSPVNHTWGEHQRGFGRSYAASGANMVTMNPAALSVVGGNLPHNNMPPYLVLNFIIALQGVFPARS